MRHWLVVCTVLLLLDWYFCAIDTAAKGVEVGSRVRIHGEALRDSPVTGRILDLTDSSLLIAFQDGDLETLVPCTDIQKLEQSLGRHSTVDHTWLPATLIGAAFGVFVAAYSMSTDVEPEWSNTLGNAMAIFAIPFYAVVGAAAGLLIGSIYQHEHWVEQPKSSYGCPPAGAPAIGVSVSF